MKHNGKGQKFSLKCVSLGFKLSGTASLGGVRHVCTCAHVHKHTQSTPAKGEALCPVPQCELLGQPLQQAHEAA